MKKIILLTLAWALNSVAFAEPSPPPAELFQSTAASQLFLCDLTTQTALLELKTKGENPFPKIDECSKKAQGEVKALFPKALATVKKSPAAVKLLKDYYGAWLTAIKGLAPLADERTINYERRKTEAKTKQEEIWNRFIVEAGI